jgi:ribosomal protein L21
MDPTRQIVQRGDFLDGSRKGHASNFTVELTQIVFVVQIDSVKIKALFTPAITHYNNHKRNEKAMTREQKRADEMRRNATQSLTPFDYF